MWIEDNSLAVSSYISVKSAQGSSDQGLGMLMYLNWNVNAYEQECQVQLYSAVAGINIQHSSPWIDFGTVQNTRSTKEEISLICQNYNQQSKLWADKQLFFILI